jgi:lipopolysaccharide transport system permease protein
MKTDLRLLYVLTLANLKSRYRNTFYGFLWVILNPILIFAVQAYAFKIIFKIHYINYTTFLLSGLLPWLFIVQSVEMCTNLFVNYASFIRNLPVGPLVLLFTQVLDNFINFLFSFLILIFIFFFNEPEKYKILLVMPLPILSLAILIGSICLIFASVNVMLRDLRFVTSFLFSLLFYLTPIFYPPQFIPAEFKILVDINPFYYVIKPFQMLTMQGMNVEFFGALGASYLVTILFVILAYFTWNKMKGYLIFYA